MSQINRRELIRYALVGAAAFAGGIVANRYGAILKEPRLGGQYKLGITEALVEMVDRKPVYHWAFEDLDQLKPMPQMPGPLIDAIEGNELEFSVTNSLPQAHGFRIPGVAGIVGNGLEIAPGETAHFSFSAPRAGSYLYFDHLNTPVNRVLGLHGPFVVMAKAGNTLYSSPTSAVQRLFNDLGKHERFPGHPWVEKHSRIWLINSIDPGMNARVEKGERLVAADFLDRFLPQYFTINGLSGAYATHDHSVVPEGRIGEPHLIRIMNAGLAHHSLHLHANHFYVVAKVDEGAENQMVQENVVLIDSVTVKPLERMDWLHPFVRPPDIPGDPKKPLRELLKEELNLRIGGVPQSPLHFPMHCHMEMSQTAAGGNYPQGLVTDWLCTGDVDGVDFPHSSPAEAGGPPAGHQ